MTFHQFMPKMNLSSAQTTQLPIEIHQNSQLFPQVNFPWTQCDFSRVSGPSSLVIPLKRRRNIKLSLKSETSDDKIRKINERKERYKRSTNNSHKKFICVAKRLLTRLLNVSQRQLFENSFQAFKSSRTYYFIILVHAKLLLSSQNIRDFSKHFKLLMNNKIEVYRNEIQKADNRNFITFRLDEIADIQYALQAYELYFQGKVEEAVETIYKREKVTVLKKNQCAMSIGVIKDIERELESRKSGHQSQHVAILQQTYDGSELMSQATKKQKRQIEKLPQSINEYQEKKQLLMIDLENSYPIYNFFYDIVFPYTVDPNPIPIPENTFPFNFAQPNSQSQLFPSFILPEMQKTLISKTASEDQSINHH